MRKDLELSLIRTDGGTQMRAQIQNDVVSDYRDVWNNGGGFPEVDVFHDGADYWLAEGFHRFFGAKAAELEKIPATIHQGTVRDAILFACGANKANGLRRSNADKRRAVEALLNDEEWVTWTDTKIAEQAGVSIQTVCNVRSELSKIESSPAARTADQPRTGRDGKKRNPRKSKAGAVSRAFESLATANGKPPKSKPGKGKNPAKLVDQLTTKYVSPLVRGIDAVAEINGGKGPHHEDATEALDRLIIALKSMRRGDK